MARKIRKYNSAIIDLKRKYKKVTYVNLSMNTLGLICRDNDGHGILQELKSMGFLNIIQKALLDR